MKNVMSIKFIIIQGSRSGKTCIKKRFRTCEPWRVQARAWWVTHRHKILATDVMEWDKGQATIMEEVWNKCNQVDMEI